jgi:formylglycine-generating enzyme required for sulfatase activity/serine/threonine protein kinase
MNDPTDQTVPAASVPPVSSGMYGQGGQLLQSGLMLPPQAPGALGTIGKYQVIKILGEGGMGQVVLAREPVTDSMVAIKLIKAEFLNKQWAVHRFLTEARHMFRMSHGSITRVIDVSDRPEGPYFVMPFMSGGSLADKIKPGEALPAETILPVARAVAEALHHAHSRGITHRDLKPSNILLDAEGKAFLADFGLLRTFLNDSIIDASQPQLEGTVPYMSPAVAAGKAEDTRCDIYAFGCLLYEMLTGQPPYQGPTVDAVLKQIQDGPPPPIRQLNPQAPAHLTAIADHAMARELRDRYASMEDVVSDLERVAHGKCTLAPRDHSTRKPNKGNVLKAAGAGVLVGLTAFGMWRFSGWKLPDESAADGKPNAPHVSNALENPSVGEEVTNKLPGEGVAGEKRTAPLAGTSAAELSAGKVGDRRAADLGGGNSIDLFGVPAGTFRMGGSGSDGQHHEVTLTKSFWLGRTEVTQAQWESVMGTNPSYFKGNELPVESVSWDDAQEFCGKLNAKSLLPAGWRFALPSSAQWEYACRAGSATEDYVGPLDEIAWYSPNSGGKTHPVASKKPNAWGFHDLHGHSAARDWYAPVGRGNGMGFRVAAVPVDETKAVAGEKRTAPLAGTSAAELSAGKVGDRRAADLGAGTELILLGVPAGTFMMGGSGTGGQQYEVTLTKSFWLGRTEVTQAQWESVMGTNPSYFKGNELPVESVSWDDAQEFCGKLNAKSLLPAGWRFALPSSAQWEYACRAGSATEDYVGPLDEIAWYSPNSGGKTHPVASKKPNAWGFHDMHGNVWEFCADWYGDYPAGSATDPTGSSNSNSSVVVVRGGSWNGGSWSNDGADCRSAYRCWNSPNRRAASNGFRVAAVPSPDGLGRHAVPAGGDPAGPGAPAMPKDHQSSGTIKDGAATIEKYSGPGGDVVTPDKINDLPVSAIGHEAFAGYANLTRVTIAATVTSMGASAFGKCPNLNGVRFGGNAPSLGEEVFQGTDKATLHHLPAAKGWGKEFGGRPTKVWEDKGE